MKDEAGWKLVTGDVFRTPQKSRSLAVRVRGVMIRVVVHRSQDIL